MQVSFEGQSVLIVGAGGGIGAATARAFADLGARVMAAGRPGAKLTASANAAGAEEAELDTLNHEMVERFFAERAPFDHVVMAAAAFKTGPVSALALEDAYACMESKFWGSYRVARAARINDSGSLTFVTGFLAHRPNPTAVLLGAVNGGLEALARGLALERSPVRVNCVSPGLVDTPLYARMPEENRSAMFRSAAARLPVKRIGQPDNIAAAITFVAANPYVTGATITVDGGGTIA